MTKGVPLSSHWSAAWRIAVFLLASTSLGCLLADFYGVCSMRLFTEAIFAPSMVILGGLALFDVLTGDGRLARAVTIGAAAGLCAAFAYDVFRLPFVFARQWKIDSLIPPLGLFKVFPAFGAMILGQSVQQAGYSTAASVVGWLYHFSNGTTIGIMYLALVGDARKSWGWAILLAVGLEAGMLLTPYSRVFDIPVTLRFVVVTLAAHGIFGLALGLGARRLAKSLGAAGNQIFT